MYNIMIEYQKWKSLIINNSIMYNKIPLTDNYWVHFIYNIAVLNINDKNKILCILKKKKYNFLLDSFSIFYDDKYLT